MIWLLRHADAADGSPDADRPLTEKGERQAQLAGQALKRLGAEIELCLTSPKVRAVETANLACEVLGVPVSVEEVLRGGPFDPRDLAVGVDDVLLVGHDPDFSSAVHTVTGAQVRMKKGGIAGMHKGELIVLLRPSEIEAIAE